MWDAISVAIPVDRYDSIAANLTAVHHVIEARRTELRHGTLALVRATFAGFAALPAPPLDWQAILGNPASLVDAEAAYRAKARAAHPDVPDGSHEAMASLNRAIAQARAELVPGT